MNTAILVWALWIGSGGSVNSGYLRDVSVAAYFTSREECVKVQALVEKQARWSQCIQANYVVR